MTMIERVARAIGGAEIGYSMKLISLVDGESTYSLNYSDGEYLEFGSTDEVYDHVRVKRHTAQARAAIEAMREPTEDMREAAIFNNQYRRNPDAGYKAMIDAALNEEQT